MLEQTLGKCMRACGFSLIAQKEGIHYYGMQGRFYPYYVNLVFFPERNDVDRADYRGRIQKIRQMQQKCCEESYGAITGENNVLSILITEQPEAVREWTQDNEYFWIWNAITGQFMIFDNQPIDFCGIFHALDDTLMDYYRNIAVGRDWKKEIKKWVKPVNGALILSCILVFIVTELYYFQTGSDFLIEAGALHALDVWQNKQYYRLISHMFLHGGIEHIINNMLILYFLGNKLEEIISGKKYLLLYFASGILAGIVSMSYNILTDRNVYSVGASGAVFGVIGAMLAVVLLSRGRKAELTGRQMLLFALLSLYGGFAGTGVDNAAHIGGFVFGFLIMLFMYGKTCKKVERVRDEG